MRCAFALLFYGSRALFMRLASTFFSKNNFKTESHGTIHILKIILLQCFHFSTINDIQIDNVKILNEMLTCQNFSGYLSVLDG